MTECVLGPEFKVVVKHSHQPEPGVDGLALKKGDIITVLTQDESSGWAYGVNGDKEGWFPFSFVQKLEILPARPPGPPQIPSPNHSAPETLKSLESLSKDPTDTTTDDPADSSDTSSSLTDSTGVDDEEVPPVLPPKNILSPQTSPRGPPTAQRGTPVRPSRAAFPVGSATQKPSANQPPPTAQRSAPPSSAGRAKPPALASVSSPNLTSVSNPNATTRAPPAQIQPSPTQVQSPTQPAASQIPTSPTKVAPPPPAKPTQKRFPPSNKAPTVPTSPPPSTAPPALPPKPANLKISGNISFSGSQQYMADIALAAASKVKKPQDSPVMKGAGGGGGGGERPQLSSSAPIVKPAQNGVSLYKPAANGMAKPAASAPINGLAQSTSVLSLNSSGQLPQYTIVRSASAPNTAATQVTLTLKPSSRPKKQMKIISKEVALKIAVLLEDISAAGAGSQHSAKNDEMEHYKEQYFATADDFAKTKSDSLTPLDVAYADCTNDDVPDELPTKINLMFHFSNGMEKAIMVNASHTVMESIREAYRFVSHTSFLPKDLQAGNCIAKLCGRVEYLPDTLCVHQVTFIRECLKRNQTVHVALVARTEVLMTALARARLPRPVRPTVENREHYFEDCHHDPSTDVDTTNVLSHQSIKTPFEIRILSCEGFSASSVLYSQLFKPDKETSYIMVEAALYCGGSLLSPIRLTDQIYITQNPEWGEFITFSNMLISDLPRHARLSLSVIVRKGTTETPLGWVNIQLVDFRGQFRTGVRFLKLWPGARANPIGTCSENYAHDAPTICFEFSNFATLAQPVMHLPTFDFDPSTLANPHVPDQTQMDELARIAAMDSLYELSTTEMTLVWTYRVYVKSALPHALPKVLLSAGWTIPRRLQQGVAMLETWPLLSPHDALELLGARFPDASIRDFALKCLAVFEDEDLSLYLLQLVQALKYEPYLTSALASFLLERALRDRLGVGQQLFWFCRTELPQKETSLRYSLLLATYLRATEEHMEILLCQHELVSKLAAMTVQIKEENTSAKRIKKLGELLSSSIYLSPTRQLPLIPTISIKNAIVDKCKVMDSAKLPMWGVFENADPLGTPASFLFKTNDDLRQDVLVLQMLRIMDNLWKQEGLDLHLTCYNCTTTGDKMGMIEAVPDSRTVARIQQEAGGATAAFKQTPLMNWLRESHTEDEFEAVVENFTRSCAGYVVGTYVLGIGDRHNDNIMVSRSGHLFHIDFGHFLGKIKYWAGIKRERAPFIFTPDFAYVLGGKDSSTFARFVALCCRSYNILRRHSHLFINLFAMMLSTSIPELQTPDDITYLRRAFMMDLDDAKATEAFTSMIHESLATKSTQVNWAVHILAHQYK